MISFGLFFHDALDAARAQGLVPIGCRLGPDFISIYRKHCIGNEPFLKEDDTPRRYCGIPILPMPCDGLAILTVPPLESGFD